MKVQPEYRTIAYAMYKALLVTDGDFDAAWKRTRERIEDDWLGRSEEDLKMHDANLNTGPMSKGLEIALAKFEERAVRR